MLIHEFEKLTGEFPDCIPIKFILGGCEIVPSRTIRVTSTNIGGLGIVEEKLILEFTYGTSEVQEQARP